MPDRIAVIGWYGHGNIGDEAYKDAFRAKFPGDELTFSDALEYEGGLVKGVFDAAILGGGDVVYNPQAKRFEDLRRRAGKALCASVHLTPNSLPSKDWKIYVRDQKSQRSAAYAEYLPDMTFILRPDPAAGRDWIEREFRDQGRDRYEKVVVCVVPSHMAYAQIDASKARSVEWRKFSQDLADASDAVNASFVFLPFCTGGIEDDRPACADVWAQTKYWKKNLVAYSPLSPQAALDLISASDGVVSGRLHASIFSTIGGVSFLDFTTHTKNTSFIDVLKSWVIPNVSNVPMAQCNKEQLIVTINKLIGYGPNRQLAHFAEDARKRVVDATFWDT